MTHKELFEALLAGKKVTGIDWIKYYIMLNDCGSLVDADGVRLKGIYVEDVSDFKIYQEPEKCFEWMIKRGKREESKK
jgi:hypothetical protein